MVLRAQNELTVEIFRVWWSEHFESKGLDVRLSDENTRWLFIHNTVINCFLDWTIEVNRSLFSSSKSHQNAKSEQIKKWGCIGPLDKRIFRSSFSETFWSSRCRWQTLWHFRVLRDPLQWKLSSLWHKEIESRKKKKWGCIGPFNRAPLQISSSETF